MISAIIVLFCITHSLAQNQSVDKDTKIFCSTRTPGAYSQGCGREVILCASDGQSFTLLCPFSTWFDKDSELCLPASLVTGCGGKKSDKKQSTMANLGLSDKYCSGIRDGYFAVSACSASVIHCSSGNANLFECPVGQAFDALRGGCVLSENIEDCRKPEKTSSSASSESHEDSRDSDSVCVDSALLTTDGCSPLYLSCFDGITKIVACPKNLAFDSELKICNWIGDIAVCSEKIEEVGHECENTDVGLFSYGNCSSSFYSCSEGSQKMLFCPNSLAFDGERRVCAYPVNITECQAGGATEETKIETEGSGSGEKMESSGADEGSGVEGSGENSGEQMDESGSGSGIETEEQEELTVHTSSAELLSEESSGESDSLLSSICGSSGDGFYSTGCSSTLIACKNKRAKRISCPETLVWDEETFYCNVKENVEECNQQEVSTQEPKKSKESSESEEPEEKSGEICNREGTYSSEQCSSHYVLCVSETAYSLRCDDGYLYSNSEGKCVPAAVLSDCFLDIV